MKVIIWVAAIHRVSALATLGMFAPRSVYLVLAFLCRPVRQQITWTRAKGGRQGRRLRSSPMMNRSASSRIVGAFVFPEFWGNSSDVPSNLAALRDVGVNAIMTESDRYDFSTLEATHNSGLRFYAGVACFSDHAANFRFIEERPELWPILESGERRPRMEWYVGMTLTDSRRQQQVLATIGSIARTYPVDGLFLDFVRWPLHWEIELRPGQRKPLDSSFDPSTLVKFEVAYGALPDDLNST